MSRRSSSVSLTTSASASTTTEDPLMKDCYDLRRRLLQTEQSINSLNPPFINNSNVINTQLNSSTVNDRRSTSEVVNKFPPSFPDRQLNSHFYNSPSEPDNPPVLTLADLSPATSDANFDFHEKLNVSYHQLPVRPSSSSDPGGRIRHQHSDHGSDLREIDQCSTGSGEDYGGELSLRKKLFKLRDKNTSLVSQNHKLMSELENMGYELHQERNNVRNLTNDFEKEKESIEDNEDRIISLEKEISCQHNALKSAEDKLLFTSQQLQDKTNELSDVLLASKNVQLKYEEELKLRKHLQSQLEETLRNVEELTGKMTHDKEHERQQNKLRCEQLERLDRELNELTNERNELLGQNTSLEGQVTELKEEITLLQSEGVSGEEYKSSLERDNADLRSTVARQSQRVGKLEKQTPHNEENIKLHELVKTQNEKIQYYQQEIERSKEDMIRLENLVQKVQEQSFRLYHTPSTVDSGISRSTGLARDDGGKMTGLRSELSFIAERNRINDRKQQELEQIISRMEDEAADYSSQLIQLEEKLAGKSGTIVSFESKVNQQNLRLVDLKTDLEQVIQKNTELQRQIHRKSLDIENLESQVEEKISDLGSYGLRMHAVEQSMEEKENYISNLETSLKTSEGEVLEHRNLLEKTKSLHSEHCRDLERQIEQLQKEYESKNNLVSQLDTVMKACRQDLAVKTARVQELEKALDGHQRELEHRNEESKECQEKLTRLQEKAKLEEERGAQLDQALKECQQELQTHIKQLEATKRNHEQEIKQMIAEISKLKEILERRNGDYRKRCAENEQLEKTLRERNEVLKQHQQRTAELETNQTRAQQQVSILELELTRERETNREEIKNLQSLLENARRDLDERTRQLNELNTSLVGVHKDMKQSSCHVVDLEQLLQQTRELLEKKSEEATNLADTLKETKTKFSENSEKYKELKVTLKQTQTELGEKVEHVFQLDSEWSKAQQEVEETLQQLKELKTVLENNKQELKVKEEKVNELDKELNESQELLEKKNKEINEKDAKVSELDHTVRECQWELKQRVSEMSKLDVSMKEQKSDLKQKTNILEHSLSQCQYELSEKALEMSKLKANYAQSQEQLKQRSVRLEYMENTMKQQQQELRKRMDQVIEFEKEFTKLKMDSEDKSEMTQELRLTREQVQNTHSELLDARRKLLQCEQKEHEFLAELDEAHGLLASKEADCTRLAKELGSSQVREAQAEARCLQEVRRNEQQYSLQLTDCENELQHLRESHSRLFSQKEEEDATHRLNIQNIREKEKANEKEIQRLRSDEQSFSEHINHFKEQLQQLQEQTHAANETIVIKESEIARLHAKVSGYERATFGSRLNFGPPDSRPSVAHNRSSSPPSHATAPKTSFPNYQSRTPVKRSSSAHDLHKASATLISFGSPSHQSSYNDEDDDDVETLPLVPRLVLASSSSAVKKTTNSNTFEKLFDRARQELRASDGKSETWPSFGGTYNGNNVLEKSLNHEDDIQ